MASQNYRDLVAWQKAMDLVVAVYNETTSFPREEIYGLVSQLRRAAISVPSNISEGQGRGLKRTLHGSFEWAHGSGFASWSANPHRRSPGLFARAAKVDTLLAFASTTGRLIMGLINSLNRDSP